MNHDGHNIYNEKQNVKGAHSFPAALGDPFVRAAAAGEG